MATRRKVENDITEVLCCCRSRCLSLTDLEKYLGLDKDELAETLAELIRNGVLERKDGLYCFPTKVKKTQRSSLTEKRLLVAQYVSAAKEPPTTAEIARALNLTYNQVYPICQRFVNEGFFEKVKKPRTKPLFFAPIIGQIIHSDNYGLFTKLNKEIRKIIEEHKLKDPLLEETLRKFFKTLLRQYPKYQKAIVSAMVIFIRTAKRARTKDEVLALLGLRPSRLNPDMVTWKSVIRSRT